MGCFFSCFDGGNKEQRKEQDRLASAEARAKAAEAAQKRQEQFEQSAAGRAARAQVQAAAKQGNVVGGGEYWEFHFILLWHGLSYDDALVLQPHAMLPLALINNFF
ncbi:hypothetical protein Godav_009118 [Gossypium davidsonii]|uniref:Small VCP/p97-interacting protein n=1 Tax=Gossypium davidsonii TaxID=34287 RepID=A0A7J8SC77_GOSDV|nr:hypothetical protein [Gossypium davidsonii]